MSNVETYEQFCDAKYIDYLPDCFAYHSQEMQSCDCRFVQCSWIVAQSLVISNRFLFYIFSDEWDKDLRVYPFFCPVAVTQIVSELFHRKNVEIFKCYTPQNGFVYQLRAEIHLLHIHLHHNHWPPLEYFHWSTRYYCPILLHRDCSRQNRNYQSQV